MKQWMRFTAMRSLRRPDEVNNEATAEKYNLDAHVAFPPDDVLRTLKRRRNFARKQRFCDPIEFHV